MLKRRKGPDRRARIATLLASAFLLATFAWPDETPPSPRPADTVMHAEPVPLDRADPGRRRLGALVFLEGWRLRSDDVRLGGISAMHVEDGQVLALSDAGSLFRFPVPRAAGTLPLNIGRVAGGPGTGRRKSDRDGESMVVAGADLWVAWEGRNAIWRYRRSDWAPVAASVPKAMERWPSMRGPEGMTRLADGRFLVFGEGRTAADGTTPLLLFEGDPAVPGTRIVPLRYRPPAGYSPTDAGLLPDGRILVLNRRFRWLSGFAAILSVAELPSRSRAGSVLEPRELAAFSGSITSDNLEALSVTREGSRTIVWIASDDNYTPILQWTLLLKFALAE
ncbi:MAG TPA: esterase-like activity of phytase family protein [Allosphingosinicella sp.]|jgi:hypothetical protein